MRMTKKTIQKRSIRPPGQVTTLHGKDYIVWIVLGANNAMRYINDPWHVSRYNKPREWIKVNPCLPSMRFTVTFIPENYMDLKQYAILSVEALHNINVQEELVVDYGSDSIFREAKQDR